MGDLLIHRSDLPNPTVTRMLSVLNNQGATSCREFSVPGYKLHAVAGKNAQPDIIERTDGSFVIVTGTLFYHGSHGSKAAEHLLDHLTGGEVDEHEMHGSFVVAAWGSGKLTVFTDWLGNVCLYQNPSETVWSTSFLATSASRSNLTINTQAFYEYVFQGTTYGRHTLFNEVERVDCSKYHELLSKTFTPRPNLSRRVEANDDGLIENVRRSIEALNPFFDAIHQAFGSRIDTALSGGFDSRLILAFLRVRGITPKLHVYGRESDLDVQIARQISQGEGFKLAHVDKSHLVTYGLGEEVKATVLENFFCFDGYPTDGIFDSGQDLYTRRSRMDDGFLLLNGGGGEIFRNFFYLPDRSFSPRQLLWTFYSQYDPKVCSGIFDEKDYTTRLMQKFTEEIGASDEKLNRTEVEKVYSTFRCRYWMSRNTSINNRIGNAVTPLIGYTSAATALTIPMRFKSNGFLEAAMINQLDPALARYSSTYGFSFSEGPGLKARIKGKLNELKPPIVRKLSFRLRHRLQEKTALSSLLEMADPRGVWKESAVSKLVDIDLMRNMEQARRTATAHYLFTHCQAGLTHSYLEKPNSESG